MSDTISSDDVGGPAPYAPGLPQPALRSGARATALTTAVSLVLVGGVVTAAVRGSGNGTSPQQLVPASAFAFAQLDLALGDGQNNALSAFLAHFPDAPKGGHGSLRDRVLAAMMRDSKNPHVDYAKDVKPWLGDKAAVAGWIDRSGKPQVEFLLRSTDDRKARSSLHRLAPKLGLAFSGGYVVVGQNQQLADQAVAAAHRASLAGDARFTADIAKLSGPQIITGWVDAARGLQAIRGAMRGANPFSAMPGVPGVLGMPGANQITGRVILGVHATGSYAELVVHSIGAHASSVGLTSANLLTHLPDGTIAAAELASPGNAVAAATRAMSMFLPAVPGASSFASGSGAYGYTHTICAPGVACPFTTNMPGGHPAGSPTLVPLPRVRAVDPMKRIEQAIGLTLPGDAVTLLGDGAVLAYGGLQGAGVPKIGLRSHPADVAKAIGVAQHSRDVVAKNSPVRLTVQAAGDDLVVTTNADYAAALASGGSLGTQSRFRAAMGTLPDRVGFAAYVDLADIVPLFSHGQRDLNRLDALGMWAGQVGNDQLMQLRLVVH